MPDQQRSGMAYGLMAYTLWGFFPLYFHYLGSVSSLEVLAQRVLWSFLFVAVLIVIRQRGKAVFEAWRCAKTRKAMSLAALLVTVNWLTFIWAVSVDRVLESSFGYFLTPLVSVFLAAVILKESLDKYRIFACVLALLGVLWQLVSLQSVPWVSLVLAVSFGSYGLVRKQVNTGPLVGMCIETSILVPFALLYLGWLLFQGQSQFLSEGSIVTVLLIGSGILTAIPLMLFAAAAKRLSLSVVGFMMYINPTLQFLVGIYLLNEPFSTDQLISFGFIWVALLVFSQGAWLQRRKLLLEAG